MSNRYRIMISGGGTGGHVFPAIAIAQAIKDTLKEVSFLFVGAKGKLEMTKVPEAGYQIVGLPIQGIQRKMSIDNLMLPFKLLISIIRSAQLIRKFRPHVVVGVGGYASGPLLFIAAKKGIPTLIQEQNATSGLTNKWLSKSAKTICVAFEGMEQYFPKQKIRITGNPVRKDAIPQKSTKEQALKYFNIEDKNSVLLVLGGSLGARNMNESILYGLDLLINEQIQLIWQTGDRYFDEMQKRLGKRKNKVMLKKFLDKMSYAYAVADVVITRAGALAIAELMMAAKPTILVPSSNLSDDHQLINAQYLADNHAALMVEDNQAKTTLIQTTLKLIKNQNKRQEISKNIQLLAQPNAGRDIANEVIKLIP